MSQEDAIEVTYILFAPQKRDEIQTNVAQKNRSSDLYECVSCLDEVLFPPQRKLPAVVVRKLNRLAIGLCLLTLVVALALTCLSYATFSDSKSCGIFAFAFDALLQAVSSVMLIWRFSSITPNVSVGRKETIATLGVALCNAVSAVLIVAPTIQLLREKEKPTHPKFSMIASGLGMLLYSILFLSKYNVSRKLGSSALMTDSIDCLGGALMGLTILVSSLVLLFTTKAWFMDSITALGIALLMFIYAATVMVQQVRFRKEREEELNGCMLMIFGTNSVKS